MGVSRGTVQRLLTQGRKKVIGTLVGQKALVVARDPLHYDSAEISGVFPAGNEAD